MTEAVAYLAIRAVAVLSCSWTACRYMEATAAAMTRYGMASISLSLLISCRDSPVREACSGLGRRHAVESLVARLAVSHIITCDPGQSIQMSLFRGGSASPSAFSIPGQFVPSLGKRWQFQVDHPQFCAFGSCPSFQMVCSGSSYA